MKITDLIPVQEIWQVIDPSKLSCYMECPRKYFYSHVLGWKSETINNHLVFGLAWHEAMEHILRSYYSEESVEEAQILFYESYRRQLSDETDGMFAPKDPSTALASIRAYWNRYKNESSRFTVLFTEIAGQVLISPENVLHFKIDAIRQDKETGKIHVLDHKTSQRRMNYWSESYSLSTQMLTYIHALYCLYEHKLVQGARVRCSFFYKSKPTEFDEAVVEKNERQMLAWLTSVSHWYNSLRTDMEFLLTEDDSKEEVMSAFPMNEKSCFLYGRQCEFFDFCCAWSNPLARCEEPPLGFQVEWWDPRTDNIRYEVDLTKKD